MPNCLALISGSFPQAERGRAIGTWSGFTCDYRAIGPVLGGSNMSPWTVFGGMKRTWMAWAFNVWQRGLGRPRTRPDTVKVIAEALRRLDSLFTINAMPGLETALKSLYDRGLDATHLARPLAELLHDNFIPASLHDTPKAVLPYLVARDTFVQRLYAEHARYWQANGEGVETFTRAESALALDELGARSEDSFRRAADHEEARRLGPAEDY